MASYTWKLCLLFVFCSCGFIRCHPENFEILIRLEKGFKDLLDKAKVKHSMINFLEDGLNEKIENITLGHFTQESSEELSEEVTDKNATAKSRVLAVFDRVNHKLKLIRDFIAQEASVDTFLAGLDRKLNEDFPRVKGTVVDKTKNMDGKFANEIDGMKSTLDSVDTYARSRNKEIAGAIYHGGIGSKCISGSDDCRLPNSGCYGDTCHCDLGFSYDALLQECVEECRHYGDTFQLIPNYIIRGFNNEALNETTVEECKTACRESTEFDCRSVEYFPRWRTCFLSDVQSSNETEVSMEYNSAGYHYQRDCAYY